MCLYFNDSHFNGSGFRSVKSLEGMDERAAWKIWTIMEILTGAAGFVTALIISFFAQGNMKSKNIWNKLINLQKGMGLWN